MTKAELIIGQTYFTPVGRRTLMAIEGSNVRVRAPALCREMTLPAAEFIKLTEAAPSRIYTHKKTGEVRTKIKVDGEQVHYLGEHNELFHISKKKWDTWRKNA